MNAATVLVYYGLSSLRSKMTASRRGLGYLGGLNWCFGGALLPSWCGTPVLVPKDVCWGSGGLAYSVVVGESLGYFCAASIYIDLIRCHK